MANLTAWEDSTEETPGATRYEWRPNVKDIDPASADTTPEYLDTGQLLISKWDDDLQQWNTYVHVAYCHIDAVGDLIKDAQGTTEFVIAEA